MAPIEDARSPIRKMMIGRALGDERERAGMTQATAAKKAGISQSTLAEIETGRRPVSVDEALLLMDLYGGRGLETLDIRGKDDAYARVVRQRGRRRQVDLGTVEFHSKVSIDLADDLLSTAHRTAVQRPWDLSSLEADVTLAAAALWRLAPASDARRARAVRELAAAACVWTDPATDALVDPLGLLALARGLCLGILPISAALDY